MDVRSVIKAVFGVAVVVLLAGGWIGAPTDEFGIQSAQVYKQKQEKALKISYPSSSGSVSAYFCKPQGQGPFPAVIYNHGGQGKRIGGAPRETCLALSQAGFIGLAPIYRPGIAFDGYVGDIFAALEYLKKLPDVDAERLGIIGFSRGGLATLVVSIYRGDLKAIVLMAPAPGENNLLSTYLPKVDKIQAPVLLQVAQNDIASPANHVAIAQATEEALKAARKNARLIVYPAYGNNGHRMFFRIGPYWQDTLAFLQNNLAATPAKTTAASDAVHQKLKELKQEVAGFSKHRMPTKEHYHRIEKDLIWLAEQGVPAEELTAIRQLLEPWNPSLIAEGDRARQPASEEMGRQPAIEASGGVLPPASGCSNDRPVLTHDFTDFSKIRQITAPGSPSAEGPKGHSFVWTGGVRVPIYVPINGVLRAGTFGLQDGVPHYTLIFQVKGSCSFEFRLAHITEPIQSIKDVLPQTAPADSRDVPATAELDFPAGSLVGYTVGNVPSGNWDFGFYDLAKEGSLAAQGASGRHRHGLCWVDYYSPEKQPAYQALLTGPTSVCSF